jgi:diacylglycerol kinase family enzyme
VGGAKTEQLNAVHSHALSTHPERSAIGKLYSSFIHAPGTSCRLDYVISCLRLVNSNGNNSNHRPELIEVILSASAGTSGTGEITRKLTELFYGEGIEARVSVAHTGASLEDFATRASNGNATTVVAGGGDGTLNAVASKLVGTDRVFGVLPLGTLNHFAKDLGIPLDLPGAVRTIISNHVVRVDVGEVNGHVFLNNSSIGLYPSIVHERQQKERLGHGKWPAFIWAAFSVLRRYPFLDVRLNVEGREIKSRTPFVFVGNNVYNMESFEIGGRARLDRGQLSIYFSHRTRRLELIALGLRALLAQVEQAEKFVAMTATEVSIETPRSRIRVSTDGEVTVMRSPLLYRVRPGALRVAVPKLDPAVGA